MEYKIHFQLIKWDSCVTLSANMDNISFFNKLGILINIQSNEKLPDRTNYYSKINRIIIKKSFHSKKKKKSQIQI